MNAIKRSITGALALAVAGGGLILGSTAAHAAASTPPWEPDPNATANGVSTLSFYNAAGQQVTGGNDLSHLFDYAVASSDAKRSGTNLATLYFSFPDHTKSDTNLWSSTQASASSNFPVTSGPASIAGQGAHRPVATAGPTEANLAAPLQVQTLDQTAGYKNLVQIRLKDSGPGVGNGPQSRFWATDISFDTANNTWQQVYPAVAQATTTTLAATPNPSTVGDNVTLKATVTSGADGTVQFKDGSSNLNAPVTVSGGTASTSTTALSAGSHALSAVFTPADPTSYATSTGTATATVNKASEKTTTALAISGGYATAGQDAVLTANVTDSANQPVGAGTVAFYDNGSASPIPGTVTSTTAGTYTLDVPAGFSAGAHSVVAKFTPTDVNVYQVSQSAAQAFTASPAQGSPCAQPGSQCTDPQPIQATVPTGTLVIATPYTAASPLDVGTLALSSDSTTFSGSAKFNDIKVTDTRAGNLPWTAKALSTPLSNGSGHANGSINGQNVGLTGLAVTKGTGFTGTVVTSENAVPANPVSPTDPGNAGLGGASAHTIATADHGQGTVTMNGTLTIIAPSSTEAGLYTGTITFTVG